MIGGLKWAGIAAGLTALAVSAAWGVQVLRIDADRAGLRQQVARLETRLSDVLRDLGNARAAASTLEVALNEANRSAQAWSDAAEKRQAAAAAALVRAKRAESARDAALARVAAATARPESPAPPRWYLDVREQM